MVYEVLTFSFILVVGINICCPVCNGRGDDKVTWCHVVSRGVTWCHVVSRGDKVKFVQLLLISKLNDC